MDDWDSHKYQPLVYYVGASLGSTGTTLPPIVAISLHIVAHNKNTIVALLPPTTTLSGITFKSPLPEVSLAHRYKKPHTPHNIVYFKLLAPSDPLALEFSGGGCGVGLLGWGFGTAFGSQYQNSKRSHEKVSEYAEGMAIDVRIAI
ncbi:hypothetical protein RJ640_021797 [Escallonia rubra]|uniref:Uncharacterized protein n=1 Tax=Escallonia rubra TaxID=112253 RepID=A0AA88QN36_9ASTE|nr:hypothetical protein RJ640_021797 [Escallonia rubra]